MSYTYPATTAIDVTFAGDAAHVYPAPGAVDVSFYELPVGGNVEAKAAAPSPLGDPAVAALMAAVAMISAPSLIGVASVQAQVFVTAKASAPSLLGQASVRGAVQASAVSSVATPLGFPSAVSASTASWSSADSPLTPAVVRAVMGGRAIGSAPAVLGKAGAMAENPVTHVQGSALTQYGAHSAAAIIAADGASTTQYGGVLARYDVSVSVDAAVPSTRAGAPLAWHIEYQAVTTVHDAYGPCLTGYGSPSAGHPQLGDVQGAALTGYGSAHAALIAQPVSVCTTVAGTPSLVGIASLPGVRTTKYGTPSNVIAHIVSGVCRTKYGKAKVRFPDARMVYGLNNGRRAGVPRAVEMV